MKKKIIIAGGGGHAKVIASILRSLEKYDIYGYTDVMDKGDILGVSYSGSDDALRELKNIGMVACAVVGIGKVGIENKTRSGVIKLIKEAGYELPTIVSPRACVKENVRIGKGSIVHDMAVINPDTKIAAYSVINTGSIIEHDCVIGKDVFISPGAVVCGGARIGDNTFIGANATVLQGITISPNCLIGAGSVVTRDCREPGIYVGTPAERK